MQKLWQKDRLPFLKMYVKLWVYQTVNAAVYAMQLFQNQMTGEAEKSGLDTEEKVMDMVKEIRAEGEY